MRNLLMILGALPVVALMFSACEKKTCEEVIVHDTIYMEFDEFTYKATGTDPEGDLIIFTDPNYPDSLRYEILLINWEYFNEIRVDEFIFFAITSGTSVKLYINDEMLAQSIPTTDNMGNELQYLEIQYNTSKKSAYTKEELIELYKSEMKRRGL